MRKLLWVIAAALCFTSSSVQASSLEEGTKAARTFLTRWLIDQNVDAALQQVSKRRLICTPDSDSAETRMRPRVEAIAVLKVGMEIVNRKLGKRARLDDSISPLPEELRNRMGVQNRSQPPEFTVIEGSSSYARGTMCGADLSASRLPTIIASFLFRVSDDEKEGMYFVFQREASRWAIVSFDRLKQ
jgi:hypothetical protein